MNINQNLLLLVLSPMITSCYVVDIPVYDSRPPAAYVNHGYQNNDYRNHRQKYTNLVVPPPCYDSNYRYGLGR
jgi:hypothetical protein